MPDFRSLSAYNRGRCTAHFCRRPSRATPESPMNDLSAARPGDAAALNDEERDTIRIRGARQNNLKNLDVDLPLGELIGVPGRSGSGRCSLGFDPLYAEAQRRYGGTFSPYARQFLDRMDKP